MAANDSVTLSGCDAIQPFSALVTSTEQSVAMEAALRKAGVDVTFVPVPGGKHGRHFGFAAEDPRLPDYLSAISEWFDSHLRKETR